MDTKTVTAQMGSSDKQITFTLPAQTTPISPTPQPGDHFEIPADKGRRVILDPVSDQPPAYHLSSNSGYSLGFAAIINSQWVYARDLAGIRGEP